jgi:nitrogen fixation protein NifB
MTPEEAISRTEVEMKKNPKLKIVAISGPGEPLANEETFTTLKGIRNKHKNVKFCLSTNGVKLEEKATLLHELGVESVSVSVSALRPIIVSKMYEWAIIDDQLLKGPKMGELIIQNQLRGITKAVELGMVVKVNTILIPEINMQEMNHLSQRLASKGVSLQNIVPLIANPSIPHLNPPTEQEIMEARRIGSQHLPQFTHCKQCRSDVVGIPGDDTIL